MELECSLPYPQKTATKQTNCNQILAAKHENPKFSYQNWLVSTKLRRINRQNKPAPDASDLI
jgi:hypothetical protein